MLNPGLETQRDVHTKHLDNLLREIFQFTRRLHSTTSFSCLPWASVVPWWVVDFHLELWCSCAVTGWKRSKQGRQQKEQRKQDANKKSAGAFYLLTFPLLSPSLPPLHVTVLFRYSFSSYFPVKLLPNKHHQRASQPASGTFAASSEAVHTSIPSTQKAHPATTKDRTTATE